MLVIRDYLQKDAAQVGLLISDTFSRFNLTFADPNQRAQMLGPFYYARSTERAHQKAIARALQADIVLVAEDEGDIVGVLRGRHDKLQSLFVRADQHRQGIGRGLVTRFEEQCVALGSSTIKVMSTLYAVPFYQAVGYKKSTGIRRMQSFAGEGLPYQPMKKVLSSEGQALLESGSR